MADETKDSGQGQASAREEKPPTYAVERLLEESHARFDEPPHVVAGALELAGLSSRKNLTIAQVEKAIKAYDDHEVEVDTPESGEES